VSRRHVLSLARVLRAHTPTAKTAPLAPPVHPPSSSRLSLKDDDGRTNEPGSQRRRRRTNQRTSEAKTKRRRRRTSFNTPPTLPAFKDDDERGSTPLACPHAHLYHPGLRPLSPPIFPASFSAPPSLRGVRSSPRRGLRLWRVHISWLRQKKGGKPADDETLQGFRGNSARETSPLSSFPPGNVATRCSFNVGAV